MNDADVEALKAFIDDNEDLEQLETILDRFNLFASLNLVRQEVRHSQFLSWLLDPSETHSLGDFWLRQFLRGVIKIGDRKSFDLPSLFDLDDWDLGRVEVRREWYNIDLLILDRDNCFVCAIENKVDTGEHSGQLERYRTIVEREFNDFKKAFVFLTKGGDEPSDESYIPMSYGELADLIENALNRRENQVNDQIKLFVQHYLDMVGRYIVEQSDVQEICRRLYQNHRRALDLIFENRPDRGNDVYRVIRDYIGSRDDLIPEKSIKTYIRFLPEWMDIVPRKGTGEWVESKRIVLCELENREYVKFKLVMGPGAEQIRKRLYEESKNLPEQFGAVKKSLSAKYHTFFTETWINKTEYQELSDEEIRGRLVEKLEPLLNSRLVAFKHNLTEIAGALKDLE